MLRLLIALLILSHSAQAQEVYAPEFCGFEVTFPDSPSSTRKCDENGGKCYDLVRYTKTFGLDASVNFQIICNPVDEAVYNRYSAEVMEATLKAMTDKSVIKTFETDSRDDNGYKQSNLIGEGLKGVTPTLFIAQLWIDKQSAFSVEAELMGEAHEEADQLFSDILKSIHVKTVKKPSPDEEKDADKKEDQDKDPKESQ
jgi:hypothetical protein